jgi:hypothetical protein
MVVLPRRRTLSAVLGVGETGVQWGCLAPSERRLGIAQTHEEYGLA